MINKSIRELENDRKDKIKNLNLEETKAYVSNLHKKMYMSNDKHEIDLCSDKIVEAFDLMDRTYLLDVYSAYWDYQIREFSNDLDMKKLNIKYFLASKSFEMFYNGYFVLMVDFETLKSLFKIYYHRYIRQSNEINHILNELSETYDFRSEDFASYLKQEFHLKEDIHLAYYVRIAIARLVISLKDFIKTMEDRHESQFTDEYIKSQLENIANRRKNEDNEKEYLDLLGEYESLLSSLSNVKLEYVKLKDEVLDFLSKDDGFILIKLDHYENHNYINPLDKEAIIDVKPKFDFESLKLDFW